jgi:Fe-S cluster assembly protein SufD
MSEIASVHDPFADHYRALKDEFPGAQLPWLARLREAGLDRFAALGFPTRKVEEWKYTDLAALRKVPFAPAPRPVARMDVGSLPTLVMGRQPVHRLVFVNGRFRADLTSVGKLPQGVQITGLANALGGDADALEGHLGRVGEIDAMPFVALNTAFIGDGFVLRLPRGAVLEEPVEVVFVGTAADTPLVYHPRNLILAGAGSRATIIEYHVGNGSSPYFANAATEILVEDGAVLRHCKVQDEGSKAFHIATTQARIGKDATFDSFVFSVGGRLSRNEIRVRLDAPGADCRLNGAYMMKGRQHVDNTTVIDHACPQTTSRELYKGVLDGEARAVFQGKIVVRPDAQKISGHQANHTLLLSDAAEIDTKPELEISADDVKCSHGATAGALDEDALFYLRSRGIPESAARSILIEAFLGEVIDGIALAGLRDPLEYMVAEWMGS